MLRNDIRKRAGYCILFMNSVSSLLNSGVMVSFNGMVSLLLMIMLFSSTTLYFSL